ncbi:hypothetical protein [Deinococcus maricopensis]|uniref:Sucrose phosphatase-like domain-containing protein n=1 Tax=Deinococcus maricopensis (strain DSM 21211 / LMG 22137 / NRRL B-23946 / LB-34) TaxID=709986 RepID=E8U3T6_DEIML|nr:hypothetical protein [Deinococcus maricopensis]ADV68779.1 hypothetical protein Deima_3151 [Deinococcus maricopensis DSM 21211]
MRILAFTDLDDTLFQTARKLPEALRAQAATVDRDGEPHSFMTAHQVHLLTHLLQDATVIPVTGRDEDAYARVTLDFPSWAILNHGATVLRPGGTRDRIWDSVITEVLEGTDQQLRFAAQAAEHISMLEQLDCTVRLHETNGLPMMVVVKHPYALQHSLDRMASAWQEWLADARINLRYFANGNNLTLIHPDITKEAAVQYVLEQERQDDEPVFTVGLGDSLADAPFMNLLDFAVTPRDSQIMRALLDTPLEQR